MASKYLAQMNKKSSLLNDKRKDESALFTIEYGSDKGMFDPENASRGVSEALFNNRSKHNRYRNAKSKEEIDSTYHNKELGATRKVKYKKGQQNVSVEDLEKEINKVAISGDEPNAVSTTSTSANRGRRGRREQAPDEEYRFLKTDPTYLKLSNDFKESPNASIALDLAKYLVGKSDNEAERFFKEALACDPAHTKTLATYAIFLETVRKNYDRAEKLYQAAAFSGEPVHLQAYATFLRTVRGEHELADKVAAAATDGGHEAALDEVTRHSSSRGRRGGSGRRRRRHRD